MKSKTVVAVWRGVSPFEEAVSKLRMIGWEVEVIPEPCTLLALKSLLVRIRKTQDLLQEEPTPSSQKQSQRPKQQQGIALRASRAREAPVHEAIGQYYDLFHAKFGRKPDFGAKDAKRLKDLIQRHTLAVVLDHLASFFASRDTWVLNSAYTVGAFASQFNKLTITAVRGDLSALSEKTRGNVHAARAFLESQGGA